MTTEQPKCTHRSVSQYNTFMRCAYKYKLERIDKVWKRPASWLSQGLAVHKAMEEWERSNRELTFDELLKIYEGEFTRSIDEQAEETPNFDYWFGSGPYSGPVDIERRWDIGKQQLQALVDYSLSSNDEIWVAPDGTKGIELGFEVEMGGVLVKGFIDQVVETNMGLLVRDIKTGSMPGDAFQLATYSEALRIMYGVKANVGDYFMGKLGKPTKPVRITSEDRADVHKAFETLEKRIQAGDYKPNPSASVCRMCDVATSCEYRAV